MLVLSLIPVSVRTFFPPSFHSALLPPTLLAHRVSLLFWARFSLLRLFTAAANKHARSQMAHRAGILEPMVRLFPSLSFYAD